MLELLLLLPRPESGYCYIGIVQKFELIDRPKFIPEYKTLRENQKNRIKQHKQGDVWDDKEDGYYRSHIGDIVQSFVVGKSLKKIPFFAIPAWIRHKLFGRATWGRIWPVIEGQDPYETISNIYQNETRTLDDSPTDDLNKIKDRLLDFVTPTILELLACELLTLDRAEEQWIHVGGSGDGGVDGLGSKYGKVCGVLQCKLHSSTEQYLRKLGVEMRVHIKNNFPIFVFSLYSDIKTTEEDGITVYGMEGIIELIHKYRSQSHFASMFGLI